MSRSPAAASYVATVVLFCTGLLNCGGSSAAPASVTGGIAGHPFTPKAAIWARGSVTSTAGTGQDTLLVKISDNATECTDLTANMDRANAENIIFVLYAVDSAGNAATLTAGSYNLDPTLQPSASGTSLFGDGAVTVLDSGCNDTLTSPDDTVTTGTVSVTSLPAATDKLSASFSVSYGSATPYTMSGTFNASPCPVLVQLANGNTPSKTCAP